MHPPVKLIDLTDALSLPQEWGAWLDRHTGKVIELDPDTLEAAKEAVEDDAFPEDLVANEELWTAARAIAEWEKAATRLPELERL
jgi:hypothetical protein